MSQKQENLIVALDIGSAWTRVVIAELFENSLRYYGHGIVESAGMRKGLIADLGPAAKAVRAASEEAEHAARINIDECSLSIGGPHIRGLNSSGGIDLGNRIREITRDDVRAAVDRARAIERPPDREILHLLHRQFILDDQPGIFDPVGMVGTRLEVELHIATCAASALQSAVTCANRAGLEVTEAVLEVVAAAEATLSADERELGVCLLDIGAHSSDLVVFYEGAVVHTASIPIGGMHFTNDVAVGLQIPLAPAEEIKKQYGNAVVTSVPQHAEIKLGDQILRQRTVAEILEPRARELFYYVKDSLRQGGVVDALGAGCVMVGGGAQLPGMLDVAESLLRAPARIGSPVRLSRMPQELIDPTFAVVIGTLLYVQRTRNTRADEDRSLRSKLRSLLTSSF